jgi:hypothetical protein
MKSTIPMSWSMCGFPRAPSWARRPSLSRRGAIIGGGVVVAAAVAGITLPKLLLPASGNATPRRRIAPVWNIGGKGAGTGQFRDSISNLTIDGQGRSAVTTSRSPIVQLFDADGHFLARWVTIGQSRDLIAALPGGDLILDGSDGFERRDAMTGRVLARSTRWTRASGAAPKRARRRPMAALRSIIRGTRLFLRVQQRPLGDDRIVYIGADGKMGRVIGPLIGKVLKPDPAIREAPEIADMAIDGAGTIYLLLHKKEDFDTREGIYVFSPEGVFLRKIEISQKFYGMIAATADGALYHADPWMTQVTRLKGAESVTIDMSDIRDDSAKAWACRSRSRPSPMATLAWRRDRSDISGFTGLKPAEDRRQSARRETGASRPCRNLC